MRAAGRLKTAFSKLLSGVSASAVPLGIIVLFGVSVVKSPAQTPGGSSQAGGESKQKTTSGSKYSPELVEQGGTLFQQRCAFCHGRDAAGGETGPDLTRSKLVASDVDGEKIGAVVRNGRPEKGMPPFEVADEQVAALAAFIHTQRKNAQSHPGGRKGVDASDLQTGNAQAGKQYFEGAGGCTKCHSASGDLADIAKRHQGLELERRMLYPEDAKSRVTVTLDSGKTVSGVLAYEDEFTVGLTDEGGSYHSWRTRDVHYKVDAPVNAHIALFSKYTDADIHNLMAYLQTLR